MKIFFFKRKNDVVFTRLIPHFLPIFLLSGCFLFWIKRSMYLPWKSASFSHKISCQSSPCLLLLTVEWSTFPEKIFTFLIHGLYVVQRSAPEFHQSMLRILQNVNPTPSQNVLPILPLTNLRSFPKSIPNLSPKISLIFLSKMLLHTFLQNFKVNKLN